MHTRDRIAGWSVPALSLMLAGCCCAGGGAKPATPVPENVGDALVHVAPVSSPVRRVAVMPFRAPTELIGASVSDLFVTELLRTGRYDLLERSQLSSVLQEAEVALSGLTDARAMELGKMIGAEGVILGSVDEYGTVARRGKTLPSIGLSVRLIDCESGSVLWSASLATVARRDDVALSQHARSVVRGTIVALARQWKVQRQVPRPDAAGEVPLREPARRSSRDALRPPVAARPPLPWEDPA